MAKDPSKNPMRRVRVEKITINIGVGEGEKLEKAIKILQGVTGKSAVKTITQKRIPDFGIRPNSPVGCKLTLRGKEALDFLNRALEAAEHKIKEDAFDSSGNFSFGVREHIDLPDAKYDPNLGVIGMDVCVTLSRPGYRVKKRKLRSTTLGKHHKLTPKDARDFAEKELKVKVTSAKEVEE